MNWDEQSGAEQAMSGQAQPPEAVPEQNVSPERDAVVQPVTAEATPAGSPDAQQATAPETEAWVVPEAPAPSMPVGDQRGLFGIQAFFTVVVYSIFVITFIVQAFQIPSSSMENTLLVGDFLLVDKMHFADDAAAPGRLLPYGQIHRGDIIVFYFPVDSSQFLVKRVIGLPGDHIRLHDKVVYVNDAPLQESYVIHKQWIPDAYRDNFPAQMTYTRGIDRRWRYELQRYLEAGEVVVPQHHYFVLGDNRDDSEDSRYWGFVPRANIIGRPLVIYLSVKESEGGRSSDKLQHSGQLAHWLQMARWDRVFRLVR